MRFKCTQKDPASINVCVLASASEILDGSVNCFDARLSRDPALLLEGQTSAGRELRELRDGASTRPTNVFATRVSLARAVRQGPELSSGRRDDVTCQSSYSHSGYGKVYAAGGAARCTGGVMQQTRLAYSATMRVVACDLDGTVIRLDGTISPRTLAALAACDKAGVCVVFVTGRPVRWMGPVVQMTGRSGVSICSNGAVSLDLSENRVIDVRPLTSQAVFESVRILRMALPPVVFAVDTLGGYGSEPGYFQGHSRRQGAVIGSLSTVMDRGLKPIKLLCRLTFTSAFSNMKADEMLKIAGEALEGVAEPVHSNPSGSMLEISARGVTKASTLARFADSVGCGPDEVVAFGDMPNDIPMLRWAGRGFAMSDGHPDAIGAATALAPPCEEDGVAQIIERILTEQR